VSSRHGPTSLHDNIDAAGLGAVWREGGSPRHLAFQPSVCGYTGHLPSLWHAAPTLQKSMLPF